MLADPHCPDTIITIQQIEPWYDSDWYINGVLPTEPGDYLNLFEEYRGLYCRGIHNRTSPWDKDFFIYSDLDSFDIGIGYAEQIGPGLGHWINFPEMKSYTEPDPHHYLFSDARSVNWYAARIDSHRNCASAILIENTDWDSTSPTIRTLGETYICPTNPIFAIPDTIIVGYVYTQRIKYNSPPHRDTVYVDLPQDSLAQRYISGHETGHMVNMGENPSRYSVMGPLYNWFEIPSQYQPVDLDSFLVKPRQ